MALIKWRDELKVGIEEIDEDHRALIDLINALYDVMQQLEGYIAPVSAWERSVLPARVGGFETAMLDRLCLSGRMRWLRSGERTLSAVVKNNTPIIFSSRSNTVIWPQRPPGPARCCATKPPCCWATLRWWPATRA